MEESAAHCGFSPGEKPRYHLSLGGQMSSTLNLDATVKRKPNNPASNQLVY
jgi:hypothetical protein